MSGPEGEVFWYRASTGVSDHGTDGNGHAGTYNGDMTTILDDGRLAFLLDGAGDYMSLPSITMTGERTVSAWVKNDAGSSGYRRIFQFGTNASSCLLWVGDALRAYYDQTLFNNSIQLTDDTWHNVIVDHDGITTASLYVDNVLINTANKSPVGFTAPGNIGATGGAQTWQGRLDDIRGYNRQLTPTERAELYDSGDGRSYYATHSNRRRQSSGLPI